MPDTVTVICALALTAGCALLGRSFLMAYERNEYARAFRLKGAAGLVLYIWALTSLSGARISSALPVFVIGYAAALIYGHCRRVNAGRLTPCAAAYIALVVFMGATACVAAVRSFSAGTLMFAAAGVCFSVSDCILCAYCYGSRRTTGMNIAVHAAYYAAQLLIAWSIVLV